MEAPPQSTKSPRWLNAFLERSNERHVAFLRRYLAYFVAVVVISSALFHVAMALEGQDHPWWIGPYWTISTMTTLGLGDVSFIDWPGQFLTSAVVLTGLVFMLVLLPLMLIQFPQWVGVRSASRVRRELPRDLHGHVLLTHRDPITEQLVERLNLYGTPYALVVADIEEALRLSDLGWSVMLGALDSPETYRAARLDQAGLMAATGSDVRNSNAVFTARSVAPEVAILATADRSISVEVLQLAGSTRVLQLTTVMARGLARRVIGGDALSHIIGRFGDVLIAESNAARTPLVGKHLRETNLRDLVDVSVIGAWDRGEFEIAGPKTEIGPHTILMLAGTREQLSDYDFTMAIYNVSSDPIVIIGGGRVGSATAQALAARGVDYRIVERDASLCIDEHYVQGDAADPAALEKAGIATAPSVVITTHDDDTNIFLSLYCRRLRPDVHLVSRATFDKNVETLHRAGADFVLSSASLGAAAIFNLLEGGDTVTVTEGLEIFQVQLPAKLAGRTLAESDLSGETGCTVVALRTAEGMHTNPDPQAELPADAVAVLIGTRDAEMRFFERYMD
jgi:Trk K+ transport system NAD-binding subunit